MEFNSTMPTKLRDRYLKIWAGVTPVHAITLPLHYIDSHFPREKIILALDHLLKKGIVGTNFVEWFNTKCQSSHLEMHRELLKFVEREKRTRRLFAGDIQK